MFVSLIVIAEAHIVLIRKNYNEINNFIKVKL